MPLAPHWGILSSGSTPATPLVSHWGKAALPLNYVPSSCPTAFDDLNEGVRVLLGDRDAIPQSAFLRSAHHGLFSSKANNAGVGKISLRLECGTLRASSYLGPACWPQATLSDLDLSLVVQTPPVV